MADSEGPSQSNEAADPGSSARPAERGLLPLLGTIGGLRDAMLVGAGTMYILGYMTWSTSAYVQGLGLLPAVDAQYFMAGIVPAAILGLGGLMLFHLHAIDGFLYGLGVSSSR
jgi:hypothetical protein